MSKTWSRTRVASFARLAAIGLISGLTTVAHGQDLGQIEAQFNSASRSGQHAEAERLARLGIQTASAYRDAKSTAYWNVKLGEFLIQRGRYAEALASINRGLAFYETSGDPDARNNTIVCLRDQSRAFARMGRFGEAEPAMKRALTLKQEAIGPNDPRLSEYLFLYSDIAMELGRFAEAEATLKRALALYQSGVRPEPNDVAIMQQSLAIVTMEQAKYAESEAWINQVLAIREKLPDPIELADSLVVLASLRIAQDRPAEAEAALKRALAIRDKGPEPNHPDIAIALNNLAGVYREQGRYAEAEPLLRRVLSIDEANSGPDNPNVARSMMNLGTLVGSLGRLAEEEALLNRGLEIFRKAYGPDDRRVGMALNNLGGLYQLQGRYAESEASYRRALAINEKVLGPDHPDVAMVLNNLGTVCFEQNRFDEAEPLLKRALEIEEKRSGPDSTGVASDLLNLGGLYNRQKRWAEAEAVLKRSLAISAKTRGDQNPAVATGLIVLSNTYADLDRPDEAEGLLKRALVIQENAKGPDHPEVAITLHNLALLYVKQGKDDEAGPLIDRSIAINEKTAANPTLLVGTYQLRAQIAWKANRRSEAVSDLRKALDFAEQQRVRTSGAELERANLFGTFANAFARMVQWQAELGDASETFSAIERAHARSFLDEINTAGADLQAGLPPDVRDSFRRREGELNSKVAELEIRRDKLTKSRTPDSDEVKTIDSALAGARTALYDLYRDERSASPVYRNLISAGSGPPRLGQLMQRLPKGSMLLVYKFAPENGYVVVAGPESAPPRVVTLALDAADAATLGVEPGPFTAAKLRKALHGDGSGVVPTLADRERSEAAAPKLEALWKSLVPEAERASALDGSVANLVIVPDRELALLPFEALVVEGGPEPKYLLDAGPPISYAPSASVLHNLATRTAPKRPAGREPLLTLGDPAYPGTDPGGSPLELAAKSRFRVAGGRLPRLPFTAWESTWVAKAFADRGAKSVSLVGPNATEARVRAQVPGRRVVHLACHGLADQAYGNLFGALAVAPGPQAQSDPSDDGFLTLREVYGLDLRSCELAILSACQTNFGPQQDGEGTWTLSRGFLVAGARRVVASDWLVDDRSAAELISVFCTRCPAMTDGDAAGGFARPLLDAKRYVRKQPQWKAPYYWAPLVMVGPP